MNRLLEEFFRIIWEGEEVSGLTLYGLRTRKEEAPAVFPIPSWPNEIEYRQSTLHGERWEVLVWDIRVQQWPKHTHFGDVVRSTLEALLEGGCCVAWVGREGHFVDPPDLFLPEFMSGGILAALTRDHEYKVNIDTSKPPSLLSDEEMDQLRLHCFDLASAD
ncbi:MAG TPA: hypothetical protein VLV83_25425 [Acidobacteriota bacterium]|nr:hypothetical protein [Acidobacteriota bacterium]